MERIRPCHRAGGCGFRKFARVLLVCSLLAFCRSPAEAAEATGDSAALDAIHEHFTEELQKYVGDGLVDYKRWRQHPEGLKKYLDELQALSPEQYRAMPEDGKKALWINAYNAFTIWLVLKNYPIQAASKFYPPSSIRQVKGFWEDNFISVGGQKASLEQIEHNVLRRDVQDPRFHFAVVPGSLGGARLGRVAYSSRGIANRLARATREYLSNEQNVRVDTANNTVYVTQLFRWFPLDFAEGTDLVKRFPPPTDDEIVVDFLRRSGPSGLRSRLERKEGDPPFKVIYEPYDWTLNEIDCSR
ncbi:MAG: DUF547 domain-containing protein [Candidatus Obscuribacterales bacterium]